jgi:hypothetical protein
MPKARGIEGPAGLVGDEKPHGSANIPAVALGAYQATILACFSLCITYATRALHHGYIHYALSLILAESV